MDMPPEFYDVMKIVEMGAKKHGKDTWLDKDNPSLETKANYASMCRHAAQSFCGEEIDEESGEDHLLHLACRSLMKYTRKKRGIDK